MGKMQRREIIIITMQNVELLSLDPSKVAQLSLEIHQFMAIIVWDFFHHSLFFFTFIFFSVTKLALITFNSGFGSFNS